MTSCKTAPPELQVIRVSAPWGAKLYTWPGVFTSGLHDLTGDLMEVSLGTEDAPGTWVPSTDPKVLASYTAPNALGESTASVELLVDSATAPGFYWVWVRLTDHPEVVPEVVGRVQVI